MLPELYQTHFQQNLKASDYILLEILISLLQSIKQVNLEKLATSLPLPILFESRRKKIQRFLSLPVWNVKTTWLSLITQWINTSIKHEEVLHLAIDRTRWQSINILVISWIYKRRAIPLHFVLLDKKGNSNLSEQTQLIADVISKFQKYKVVILGDREFCSVDLGSWLREKKVYFCLRLKKNNFVELESKNWCSLQQLGLKPGISFYLRGVKMTKTKQVAGFDLAAKWQKKRYGLTPEEGWFILTNLGSLEEATTAYKKRFGIEEAMQRGLVGFQQRATASRQCFEILRKVVITWKELKS